MITYLIVTQVSEITLTEFGLIVGCIMSALSLRLLTAFLVALANDLSVKESLFIAITWIPKAIVEVRKNNIYIYLSSKKYNTSAETNN